MSDLKNEFAKGIMIGLKIEDNPFLIGTVKEYLKDIKQTDFKDFMTELFGTQHAFLNGLDRVAKVAEQFKPQIQDNLMELKAKELIQWCESANSTVFDNATKSGRTFKDEMRGTKFMNLSDCDRVILNQIKPYCEHKILVSNIRAYRDSIVQLKAFMDALKYTPMENNLIGNSIESLRLKR